MKKRTFVYFLLLIAVTFGVMTVYQAYEPKAATIVENPVNITYNFNGQNYSLAQLRSYLKDMKTATTETSGEEAVQPSLNVIFYNRNDLNSQYFLNTTLPKILNTYNLKTLDNVIYVDTSDLEEGSNSTQYGYTALPALINISYQNGSIVVNSILQNDGQTVFTSESIITWLQENQILPLPQTEE